MSRFEEINIKGVVSENNSTNTPLAGGATFTGAAFEILNYGIVFVSVYTDVASAIDGLEIQQSIDGTNWDFVDSYTISAGANENYGVNPHGRYLRVVYNNGVIPQTVFRLLVVAKGNSKPSSHRVEDRVTTQDDAELVKSVIAYRKSPDEEYYNVDVQSPFPSDGDSIYAKDVWTDQSDMGDFSGVPSDLFNNLHSVVIDSTANNPKIIQIHFNRTVISNVIGIGSYSGNFSNVRIYIVNSGAISSLVIDESTNSTKYTSRTFQLPVTAGFNEIKVEFHTADTVTLSNLVILKTQSSVSRLQAVQPDNTVVDISATNQGNMKISVQEYGDTPAIDAFDRLRVSTPYTIFDSKLLHDNQPLLWDQEIGGSATSTHNANNSCNELVVTASASDYIIDQTKQRFNYQPGKSHLILMTAHSPQETGVTKRIGYFSTDASSPYYAPKDGIYLEVTENDITFNIAKNGSVTESVSQSNWNVDTLDGTGYSGITLDLDAVFIMICDFEYLGVGRVRVGFVINGLIIYCHHFNHANDPTFTSVYMKSPNLPLTYTIASDGTGGGQLDHICSTVMSEGGLEKTGVLRSIDQGTTTITATTIGTVYALLGIRLKTAYNDISVFPEAISMISTSNDSFRWSIHLNPTVAGTFTYNDITNSAVQYAVGATANTLASLTDGIVIASGYGSSETKQISVGLRTALLIGSTVDGTRDTLVLAVTPLGSNATILASMTFREMI